MKKLSPDADQGATTPKNNFDPENFKNEIIESNKQMMTTLQSNVEGIVKDMLARVDQDVQAGKDPASVDDMKDDFASEIDELGIDDKQSRALLRMFDKAMEKKAPNWKNDVLSSVDDSMTQKDLKAQYDQEVLEKYPEAGVKNSQLHKLASEIYSKMSPNAQREPDAQANAVLKAAARLNVAPMSLAEIKSRSATNDTGGGPKTISNSEPDRSQIDFGVKFGNVDPDKFKEKLKLVNSRKYLIKYN